MSKVLKTIVQLRRDNSFNYEKIKDTYIPLNGEVVLVDTSDSGLRAKVGDGVSTYAQLGWADAYIYSQIYSVIVRGYYYNGVFYADAEHNEDMGTSSGLYIDIPSSKLYTHDGNAFICVNDTLPTATASVSGTVKLYSELGSNTDGTITQKRLTEEFERKFHVEVASDDVECLIFSI